MQVGYIGLGNMGAPMAGWLLDAGFALTIHDLRRDAAEALEAKGAVWASTPSEVAENSDVVCTCLPGPSEMHQVYLGAGGVLAGIGAGAYCIDHTTNDPKVVQAVGGALTARGVGFLDAPLDGGREGAVAGELNLFVGGEEVVVETLRSVLGAAARNVVHVGALGTGSTTKIVHNALAMSIDLLITECLTVGVKAGVALPSLVEAFSHGCIVSENMTFTKRMPATLFRGDFSARFALKLAHKDFGLARDLAAEHGVPVQLLSLCAEELAEAVRRGWGEEDRTRASSLQEERAGIELRVDDG